LINAPGLYNLKGIAIDVSDSTVGAPVGDNAFLALLPFVIRPRLKEDRVQPCVTGNGGEGRGGYAAVDCLGPAALIDRNGLSQRRDDVPLAMATPDGNLCMVRIRNV
jgi:hypothetical protein